MLAVCRDVSPTGGGLETRHAQARAAARRVRAAGPASVPPGAGGHREGGVYAGEEVGDRRYRAACVPPQPPRWLRPDHLLYFAAVLAHYLLRNSKIIRLAGRAMVSNR